MTYSITDNCIGCMVCKRICPTGAIYGEKKQVQEINPDQCIACGACGHICPKSAIMDPAGVICTAIKKSQLAIPIFNHSLCVSCNSCMQACPVSCIAMTTQAPEDGSHAFPYLAKAGRCISCGFCEIDCPVDAITMEIVPT